MRKIGLFVYLSIGLSLSFNSPSRPDFAIRTITAGVSLAHATDTMSLMEAIHFLQGARQQYLDAGYTVQTVRITTQHLYLLQGDLPFDEFLQKLKILDQVARRENVILGMGWLLPPNRYEPSASDRAAAIIRETQSISFSLPISDQTTGIYPASIRCSAEIIHAIARNSPGGEGNFRFTATANCPPNIPFFPAGYHLGDRSFAIGLETPNLIRAAFGNSSWADARQSLTTAMEKHLKPVEHLALEISRRSGWPYDGIDTSPAPGLEASIGEAIETLTDQPFGSPLTLSACAIITGVLKNLDVRRCGYSGLMLPVIEDPVLAGRASEGRYSWQDLLLYSSVSGTGLDVVPLPGETSVGALESIIHDVATLSLKYDKKALSARLFPIPGKKAGEQVSFSNPYLTSVKVMAVN